MNISANQNHPSFSAKFINNKAFQEVVKYAEETKQLQLLDDALNRLNNTKTGDILLIHGKTSNGVYSNFSMGNMGNKKSILNLGAETPEKASFDGIIELGELGRKFRRLIGGEFKSTLKSEDIIKKYSV